MLKLPVLSVFKTANPVSKKSKPLITSLTVKPISKNTMAISLLLLKSINANLVSGNGKGIELPQAVLPLKANGT